MRWAGVICRAQVVLKPLTKDDCPAAKGQATVRHAFVDDGMCAMAGSSANHHRVVGHLFAGLPADRW